MDERLIWGIRIARVISASLEVVVALLLLNMTNLKNMIRLNSVLGLAGPLVFITVSALGLTAGLGKLEPHRLLLVLAGVVLVILGTR